MGCVRGASGSHLPHERACLEKSHCKEDLGRSRGVLAGEERAALGLEEASRDF